MTEIGQTISLTYPKVATGCAQVRRSGKYIACIPRLRFDASLGPEITCPTHPQGDFRALPLTRATNQPTAHRFPLSVEMPAA